MPPEQPTIGQPLVEYGRDAQGGLIVLNNAHRIGYYAYPTSENAEKAHTDIDAVIADALSDSYARVVRTHDRISPGSRESRYLRLRRNAVELHPYKTARIV